MPGCSASAKSSGPESLVSPVILTEQGFLRITRPCTIENSRFSGIKHTWYSVFMFLSYLDNRIAFACASYKPLQIMGLIMILPVPITRYAEVSRSTGCFNPVSVSLYTLFIRNTVRHLAKTLIVILILISPLSFSTDKVPNFAYECPVSSRCEVQSRRILSEKHQTDKQYQKTTTIAVTCNGIPESLPPTLEQFSPPSPSRSPPA